MTRQTIFSKSEDPILSGGNLSQKAELSCVGKAAMPLYYANLCEIQKWERGKSLKSEEKKSWTCLDFYFKIYRRDEEEVANPLPFFPVVFSPEARPEKPRSVFVRQTKYPVETKSEFLLNLCFHLHVYVFINKHFCWKGILGGWEAVLDPVINSPYSLRESILKTIENWLTLLARKYRKDLPYAVIFPWKYEAVIYDLNRLFLWRRQRIATT